MQIVVNGKIEVIVRGITILSYLTDKGINPRLVVMNAIMRFQ